MGDDLLKVAQLFHLESELKNSWTAGKLIERAMCWYGLEFLLVSLGLPKMLFELRVMHM